MKKIIHSIRENYRLVLGVLVAGLFLGWLFFHPSKDEKALVNQLEEVDEHDHSAEQASVWTCSMHPQIRQDKPGKCPICAMDLIPVTSLGSSGNGTDPNEIMMSESATKLAEIQTMTVSLGSPQRTVYLQGKVQADERNIAELTARFGGRIEKLFVNFTGQQVQKGEKLATIYSPDMVSAQQELFEASAIKETRPSLYEAARTKLRLWDLTEEQIESIEKEGEPMLYFDIQSPISGTIMTRHVAQGDYVTEGSPLFQVTDLSSVWVVFDAYESDLPWISRGDQVELTIQSLPGQSFEGRVSYIDPYIDPSTRVAGVRIELPNQRSRLKPEMFVKGRLQSKLAGQSSQLMIPKSSILWTGKRSVVYVKVPDRESPTFLYREITLGPEAGEFYVVADGLEAGEQIAVNGVFKIDASAQLEGKTSMMNPEGGIGSTGHNHGAMEMPADKPGTMEMPVTNTGESMDQVSGMKHVMVMVAGSCEMCKERIENAALSVEGVETASWEAETQMLHLNFNAGKTNSAEIQQAIARVGHDTEDYRAPDEVYNELPECCLYERLKYN